MKDYFIKYIRNPQIIELGIQRPTAVILLLLVVNRAKNSIDIGNPDLEIGEAFIGDYKSYGVSEQVYRTDKNILKKFKILTYRTTNKGTIAKLINKDFFDIEWKKSTDKLTDNQRTTNEQLTTNREIRNIYTSKEFFKEIPPLLTGEYIKTFGFSEKLIKSEALKAFDWLESKGKTYKNYKAFFNNWLRNVAERNKVELPVGEYLNSDGTWTVIKIDKGKRIEKQVNSEDYLAQRY
jgi:hypothetical protein